MKKGQEVQKAERDTTHDDIGEPHTKCTVLDCAP